MVVPAGAVRAGQLVGGRDTNRAGRSAEGEVAGEDGAAQRMGAGRWGVVHPPGLVVLSDPARDRVLGADGVAKVGAGAAELGVAGGERVRCAEGQLLGG